MGIESIFAAWMELYFLWDPQWLHSPSASRPQRHSPHHRSCPAKSYHEHLGPAGGLVQCPISGVFRFSVAEGRRSQIVRHHLPPFEACILRGETPVQRLKARENAAGSENPNRQAVSFTEAFSPLK